jgi:Ca2+-binding RTX toxin-like protein
VDRFTIGDFGNDSLFGGAGNDVFLPLEGTFSQIVDGTSGSDTVDATQSAVGVPSLNLNDFVSVANASVLTASVFGTSAANRIVLIGRGGVMAGAGDDTIVGGNSPDVLDGVPGNDVIDAGGGNDSLRGGPGDDTIFARDNSIDRVYGGGNDRAQVNQTMAITDIVRDVETILP